MFLLCTASSNKLYISHTDITKLFVCGVVEVLVALALALASSLEGTGEGEGEGEGDVIEKLSVIVAVHLLKDLLRACIINLVLLLELLA